MNKTIIIDKTITTTFSPVMILPLQRVSKRPQTCQDAQGYREGSPGEKNSLEFGQNIQHCNTLLDEIY